MIDCPLAVVRSALPSLQGAAFLDVGCGDGAFAQALTAEGAEITGIDPNPSAIEAARLRLPAGRFDRGTAERLPFPAGAFDAVLFMNSLHHVPVGRMDQALHEAGRVLRPNGALIVIEPLASGSLFEALRHIDDETRIRHAAQSALVRVAAAATFERLRTMYYTRQEVFVDFHAFLDRIIRVDPARRRIVDANRAAIVSTVLAVAQRLSDREFALDQPVKADILRVAKKELRRRG